MATDLQGFTTQEVLNKVLNTTSESFKVDIVSGSEYAEDSSHTDADTGQFILGVRNDTLAALGGTDGDYVPFQMNSDGALYVEISSGGGEDAVYADDADWTDGSSKHMLVGGLYQSSPQSITDGDVGPFQVDADGALHISDGGNAITVDGTVTANAGTNLNTSALSTHAKQDTMITHLGEIEGAVETIETTVGTDGSAGPAKTLSVGGTESGGNIQELRVDSDGHLQVDALSSALPSGAATAANQSTIIGHVDGIETLITSTNSKIDTFDAVLDNILTKNTEIDAVLDTIKTDTGTIDSDTDAIKTATESSNTHLGNMFYDTALAVTPSDGSDLSGEPYYAVYVGTGGDLKVDMADGGSAVTLSNVASGQLLPIMVERIYSTDTTASNIIAFK